MLIQELEQNKNQDVLLSSNIQSEDISQYHVKNTQNNCNYNDLDQNSEINYQNNDYSMPNVKLPLTMVGNVALSKGMYLTLMKRREQKVFGNTSYFCTPRPRTTQNKVQIGKQYSSCARINTTYKFNNSQSQHNFNVRKSYKEIHKTKKIKKENQKENAFQRKSIIKASQNNEDNFLTDITYRNNKLINGKKRNTKLNQENISKTLNEKQNDRYQISDTLQKQKKNKQNILSEQNNNNKYQMSQMRNRSKQFQNEKNNADLLQRSKLSSIKIKERNKAIKVDQKYKSNEQIEKNRENYDDIEDKENNMSLQNINQSQKTKYNLKNKTKSFFEMPEEKYSYIWHQETQDLRIEQQMFIKQSKQENQQLLKQAVPGYRVKFETSKNKIYAFNCFREKDLQIEKQFRNTVDQQLDNDCETDCEQIKNSIYNVFQSLCVAVCEEKINAQYQRQNYYNNNNQI